MESGTEMENGRRGWKTKGARERVADGIVRKARMRGIREKEDE